MSWYDDETDRENDGAQPLVTPNPILHAYLAAGGSMVAWMDARRRGPVAVIFDPSEEISRPGAIK